MPIKPRRRRFTSERNARSADPNRLAVNWLYLRESAMDQRLEEAPGKSAFRSLSLVFLGETNMAVLPLELRWLHLVVAVSYQKINTPVAHQCRGLFPRNVLSPERQRYDIFRNEQSKGVYVYMKRRVRARKSKTTTEELTSSSRFIPFCLTFSIALFVHPRYGSSTISFSLSLSLSLFLSVRSLSLSYSTVGKSGLNGNRKIRFPDPVNGARQLLSFLLSLRFTSVLLASSFASFFPPSPLFLR